MINTKRKFKTTSKEYYYYEGFGAYCKQQCYKKSQLFNKPNQ